MKKIVAIIGESGSGKTTASKYLAEIFGFNLIVSYTTRPIRHSETNGIDHWFVNPEDKPEPERMCAYTQFGGYEYWTEWKQVQEGINLYVIDEKGLENLKAKNNSPFDYKLISVKINRKNRRNIDKKRKERDKERIPIPDELYDYIIDNDGSMDLFRASLCLTAQCIIQKY